MAPQQESWIVIQGYGEIKRKKTELLAGLGVMKQQFVVLEFGTTNQLVPIPEPGGLV